MTGLVRQVLQTGLEVEMAEHLGYERHAVEGRGSRHLAPGDGADLRGAHGANSLRYASKKHWGQITKF